MMSIARTSRALSASPRKAWPSAVEMRGITVPTTVLHARDELEIPTAQGRIIASSIPNARLVSLDSKNHILGENEPAWQEFLREIDGIIRP